MNNLKKIGKVFAILIVMLCIFAISSKLGAVVLAISPILYLVYLFKKGSKFKNYNRIIKVLISCFFIFIALIGFVGTISEFSESENNKVATVKQNNTISKDTKDIKSRKIEFKPTKNVSNNKVNNSLNSKLKVYYINVGQGDCILVQQDSHNMLIDAGTNASTNGVVEYLHKQNIKKLEYVIGTHPHEDHIGGLDKVIDAFDIGTIIMPKATANTKTFKDVITSIKNKNLKITTPHVGDNYKLGAADFTILAPNKDSYKSTNDYSIVSKLKFGNNSFIFTGDAEALSEGEILQKQLDISSDVLKVGHHGSKTSTTQSFLDKVNPKYAVISCGKLNKYGHPTQETLDKLKAKNVELYRTDECGTIIATSDGKSITFNCKQGSFKGAPVITQPKSKPAIKKSNPSKEVVTSVPKSNNTTVHKSNNESTKPVSEPARSAKQVWLSATGSKYHSRPNCGRMNPNTARQVSIEEAQAQGYDACRKCRP